MPCPKCNFPNPENSHYCPNCAHQLIKPPPFYKRHKILTVLGSLFILLSLFFIFGVLSFISNLINEIESESAKKYIVSGSEHNNIELINIDGVIVENDPTNTFSSFSDD